MVVIKQNLPHLTRPFAIPIPDGHCQPAGSTGSQQKVKYCVRSISHTSLGRAVDAGVCITL